ncbi:hypothetical protein ACWOA0_07385 [Ignavigranum ruoffiae]|mgnify:CR=1 FL=1|uniref:Uncharacterized protein n=1 Tax=Ignavigranum ruoffiae TaxID=89093 RepID=A0A1H9CKS2_9LACT|nr:hypothetical protein [Ignavigranum ruoffiae]UPQ86626.1 hypothetical protein M0R79_04410 [Ignavigranum ruoffiae]SEQ01792.1 hypothetical protein SAMN04488558_10464 [Ignavigranum ruoffiae]
MDTRLIIFVCGLAICVFGGIQLARMIYRLTVMDAKARHLPYPRFWGIFNLGGNNGGGNILLYLLGRRQFPIKDESIIDPEKVQHYKQRARLALAFHLIGAVILIIGFFWYFN